MKEKKTLINDSGITEKVDYFGIGVIIISIILIIILIFFGTLAIIYA